MNTPYREQGPCQECARRERARWRWRWRLNPDSLNSVWAVGTTFLAMLGAFMAVGGWIIHGLIPAVTRMTGLAAILIVVAVVVRVEKVVRDDK